MSDTEVQPQKQTKRKSSAEIRKARREKERIAREGALETQQSAHQYLQTWDQHRKQWKFNKAKQLWIVRHLYSESQVPAPLFDIAVRYLGGTKGMLRDSMLKDARLISNPAEAITEQQKQLRTRALGLMPTHVTKGEAKAKRRVNEKAAATATTNTGQETSTDKTSQTTSVDEDDDTKEDEVSDVPLGIRERADRVIEILTSPIPVEPELSSSQSDDEGSKKRKQTDGSDSSDSDSETRKKSKKHKSKGSKSKKSSKDKKDKKDKKSKDKKERKHKKSKEDV
ncbi:hypothetical protein H4S08_002008 [Coemansia sp. RSA 1365]|nr:hypothetical protein H4S08_002008 [Coemansia sp. RSA 1365]